MRVRSRLAIAVLALALAATACGDDDASPTTTEATTTTVAPTTTTPPTTAPKPTPGGLLAELLARYETAALRTTYVFRDSGEETTVILSQDPTADPPVTAVIIPEANTKLITIGDESIFCDTEGSQCFSVPAGGGGLSEGLLGPFAGGLFLAADLDGIPGVEVSQDSDEVAGRTGTCFTFVPPADSGFDTDLIRQCLDAELGFTLLIQVMPTGSSDLETIMELVEFGEPMADDFTPTGPVTETP